VFGSHPIMDLTEVAKLVELLSPSPGMTILDLGCGVGRHALELARRGFHVTAVDRVPRFLEEASARAKMEGLSIEFVNLDMADFCRRESFDIVVSLFTSFGYGRTPEEDRQVLVNILDSLKIGGQLLLDMAGKEIVGRQLREKYWHQINGLTYLEESEPTDDWSRLETRWIVIEDETGREASHRISHSLYSAVELKTLLASCGYQGIKAYGDMTRIPYDHRARRLIVTARRPGPG
jgi:SAM-dependent methyltransferase